MAWWLPLLLFNAYVFLKIPFTCQWQISGSETRILFIADPQLEGDSTIVIDDSEKKENGKVWIN